MNIIERPLAHGGEGNKPNRIIVHAMAERIPWKGKIYYAQDFLDLDDKDKGGGLSAHALIWPNGDVMRCRNDDQTAWHAKGHNKNTLGVEFLVEGEHTYGSFLRAMREPYVYKPQFDAGVELLNDWMSKHNIKNIVRHSDIDPDRKQDPGSGFNFKKLIDSIDENLMGEVSHGSF